MSGFVFNARDSQRAFRTLPVPIWIVVLAQPFIVAAIKLTSAETASAAPFALFYTAIVLSAITAGVRAGLMVTAISACVAALFFLPPTGDVVPASNADAGRIALFLGEGAVIGIVTGTLRNAFLRTRAREVTDVNTGRSAETGAALAIGERSRSR